MKPKGKLANLDDPPPAKKVKNPRSKKPSTLGQPQIMNPRSTRSQREKSVAQPAHKNEGTEEDIQYAFAAICAS